MKTDVVVGARTLKCAGTLAKTDIVLKYTPDSTVSYQTITESGTFTVPSGNYNRVQFFAVGGGGGSNSVWDALETLLGKSIKGMCCGGGGGGYVATATQTVSAGNSFTIVVGAGGKGSGKSLAKGTGSDTTVSSGSTVILTAKGGGGIDPSKYVVGGPSGSPNYLLKGGDGGSGGGPAVYVGYTTTGITQGKGGNNGSDGSYGTIAKTGSSSFVVGTSITAYSNIPKGAVGSGAGTSTTFNGVTYAYGGNGAIIYTSTSNSNYAGSRPTNGSGGLGGERYGGGSTGSRQIPTAGAANTGSGGGGRWFRSENYNYDCQGSTDGGSGVVIVKLWEA